MFLLDTLLLAPGKAAFFLLEELAKKAQEEFLNDDVVKQELQEIYALLEAGRISETDFEAREIRLVERLEQIAMAKQLQDGWGASDMGGEPAALEGEVMEEPEMVTPPETYDDDVASPAPYAPLVSNMMTPPALNAQMLSDIMKTPATDRAAQRHHEAGLDTGPGRTANRRRVTRAESAAVQRHHEGAR